MTKNKTRRKKGGIDIMKFITGRTREERKQYREESIKKREFMNDPKKRKNFDNNVKMLYLRGKIPEKMKELFKDPLIAEQQLDTISYYLAEYGNDKLQQDIIILICIKGWSEDKFNEIIDFAIKNKFFDPEIFDTLINYEKEILCKYLSTYHVNVPLNNCVSSVKPILQSVRV